VYSIQAQNVPAQVYEDTGFVVSAAPCDPAKADEVVKEVMAIFQAYAEAGPTDEELTTAKKQVANNLDTQLKEPSYWFERLKTMDLHKLKLEDLKNIPESYEKFTAEQVRDTFRRFHKPERMFDLVARPASDDAEKKPETKEAQPAKDGEKKPEAKPVEPAKK
jgi:zinc protease